MRVQCLGWIGGIHSGDATHWFQWPSVGGSAHGVGDMSRIYFAGWMRWYTAVWYRRRRHERTPLKDFGYGLLVWTKPQSCDCVMLSSRSLHSTDCLRWLAFNKVATRFGSVVVVGLIRPNRLHDAYKDEGFVFLLLSVVQTFILYTQMCAYNECIWRNVENCQGGSKKKKLGTEIYWKEYFVTSDNFCRSPLFIAMALPPPHKGQKHFLNRRCQRGNTPMLILMIQYSPCE